MAPCLPACTVDCGPSGTTTHQRRPLDSRDHLLTGPFRGPIPSSMVLGRGTCVINHAMLSKCDDLNFSQAVCALHVVDAGTLLLHQSASEAI